MDLIKGCYALGLVSGSSLDGVSAAIIKTDGVDVFEFGPTQDFPFDDNLRESLNFLHEYQEFMNHAQKKAIENEFTNFNASIVKEMQDSYSLRPDVIGFCGHTIIPNPLYQVGDGKLLADLCSTKVVSRFPAADISSGGFGGPLTAVYHMALAQKLTKPLVFLDIGGVTTLTWIGSNGEMLAFDSGPGNNVINYWVFKHGGQHMDYNGRLAALGKVNEDVLNSLLRDKYLKITPPKIAAKNIFKDKLEHLEGLNLEDGAATVTSFVAAAATKAIKDYVPEQPSEIIVCGGGAKNPTLLRFLRQKLDSITVKTGEDIGLNSSSVEAQAYAFLAVRRLNLMPTSYPFTTGVPEPCICGEVFEK